MHTNAHFFRQAIVTGKVGQADPVFGVWEGSLLWVCACKITSLCAPVTICATPVNIQTETRTAFWPVYINSSVSCALC